MKMSLTISNLTTISSDNKLITAVEELWNTLCMRLTKEELCYNSCVIDSWSRLMKYYNHGSCVIGLQLMPLIYLWLMALIIYG